MKVALEQFARHGYGVPMNSIITAAGISKTTMYSRYPSKEQLFRAIIRHQIQRVAEAMPLGPPRDYFDLDRGLRNYANRALAVSLEPSFLEANRLIYSEARRFPELSLAATERHQIGVAELSTFIRHRADTDGVPCNDPESVANILLLLMRGWYVGAMLSKVRVSEASRRDWVNRSVRILIASRPNW